MIIYFKIKFSNKYYVKRIINYYLLNEILILAFVILALLKYFNYSYNYLQDIIYSICLIC